MVLRSIGGDLGFFCTIVIASLSALGCGKVRDEIAPEAQLDQVLARTYQGRSLRQIVTQDPHPRYVAEVIVAFRVVLGDQGGYWLGRTVASGVRPDKESAFWLLDSDIEAARECRDLLLRWLDQEDDRKAASGMARLLFEVGERSSSVTGAIATALRSDDGDVAFHAAMQIRSRGALVDYFAEDILSRVEGCPHARQNTFSRPEELVIGSSFGSDLCHEFLALLKGGGKGVNRLVPRISALLRRPRTDKASILGLLETRGQAAAAAIPNIAELACSDRADVRAAVARALGAIGVGSDLAIETVKMLRDDVDGGVRKEASVAIQELAPGG